MHAESPGAKTTMLAVRAVGEPIFANAGHAALFDRIEERIRRYFHGVVWNPDEAEDLAQKACLELTRSVRSGAYDPTRSFNAWLWIKVHAIFVDWCRERRRRFEPLEPDEASSPSQEPAIDRRLDALSILDMLRRRLGTEGHEIFLLRHEGGLTKAEIADMLGRDRKTVAKRLAEADEIVRKLTGQGGRR
ncbi:MAG TPA: sigma-70 family RNA polymerase sigma factor [Planctomycetota bacterium]|nr:sigma-70 family RNA polymerase sigma factor [Planctomycetota bacterium]